MLIGPLTRHFKSSQRQTAVGHLSSMGGQRKCTQLKMAAGCVREAALGSARDLWAAHLHAPRGDSGLSQLCCICLFSRVGCLSLLWLFCDPTDCSLPGFPIHGMLQARILEWVVFPFSRGLSQPRDWTQVPHIAGRFFNYCVIREAL